MKRPVIFYWMTLLLRLGFGGMLIAASLDKILQPLAFAQAVENYGVIGESLSYWVAVWLPYLEALTGLLLIAGIWLDAAIWINGLLMGLFLLLVSQAYARGLDISCGCFRVEEASAIGLLKLLENIAFAAGGILLLLVYRNRNRRSS